MTSEKRPVGVTIVFVLATLAVVAGCRRETAEEVESQTPVSVKTVPAAVGDIYAVVHATGVVTAAAGAELVVIAPETARIAEIPHAAGDRVRRGDLLVRFEIPTATADVSKQRAEVDRARATLENARAAQARARDLFERGVAARRETEDASRILADAEAGLAQAQASLDAAEMVAARSSVRAPFDGVVTRRQHNPGDLVEPSATDPVLRVVDMRRLEIVAAVPLADALRVRFGAPGRLAGRPTDTTDVQLEVISRPTEVESGAATIPVRLGINGAVDFPLGAPLQVDIEAEHHANVVRVPVAALVREGEDTSVFVASAGTAERRSVETGVTDGSQVEIVRGVAAGDLVIVDGQAGLPSGASITVDGNAATAADKLPAGRATGAGQAK